MIGTRRWLDCVTATQVLLPGSCLQAVPMNQSGHWMGQFDGFGTIEFDVSTPAD
jgi:2-keto-4-pentenoate hydratase